MMIRVRTDCLDAAGNTTAAFGKGFAIGIAAFVSSNIKISRDEVLLYTKTK